MDRKRPFWQTALLHAVLIGGSVVFALPFIWLAGTSWKLDKELQTEGVHIFPTPPVARAAGPYIDPNTFAFERPESIPAARWDGFIAKTLQAEVGAAIDHWSDPRTAGLDAAALREQLLAGALGRLRGILAPALWEADEPTFRAAVRTAVTPELLTEVFEQAYRYLALGKVVLKDKQYRIYDLTGQTPIDQVWKVESGPLTGIEPRVESGRPVAVLHYDWSKSTAASDSTGNAGPEDGQAFELSATFKLPVDFTEFQRLDVSFRRDESWHALTADLEIGGTRYRSVRAKHLGEDTWWDVQFQKAGPDDARLIPHRYVLINPDDSGPQYNHGDRMLKLRLRVTRNTTAGAYWAKMSENYRKVFEEVPFWRYLSTSAFLALANIVGTCLSCSLAAYAFARLQFPGRDLCFILVLATLMIPPQVTMIPSFIVYRQLGWYNTLAPLWVPSCLAGNAFAIFLLRQAMKGLPRDLEDAARIDGCGYWRIYWHVALPLMKPTLAAISVFTFMYVWNDFLGPLIYVNDQRLYPLALGLFSFMAGRENQFTLIMAGAMVMTLPVILTFFLLQRYFIQGVALTGLKN